MKFSQVGKIPIARSVLFFSRN